MKDITYSPAGAVVREFHRSDAFVRILLGPVGSGKSTACAVELLRRAQQQKPSPDGIRRSRIAILRNSFPELRSTTIKTWEMWVPPEAGKMTFDSPISHRIKTEEIDAEFLFMALDRPEDARKLLSLELTAAWLNECREIPREILNMLTSRVGRYPSAMDGGPSWYGIIADSNMPDDQNWVYSIAEVERPEGFQVFRQPGGLTPGAENRQNLPLRYYENLSSGKDPGWLAVYRDAQFGYLQEGRPVFPQFKDAVHVPADPIKPVDVLALQIGFDPGLQPAAIIGQRMPDGRWLILDEVIGDNVGTTRFGEMLAAHVRANYPGFDAACVWADPAANARAMTDERTPLEILKHATGWRVIPAPGSNDLELRLEGVRGALNRMVDGKPGFLLNPKCKVLRKALNGGYCYRAVRTAKGDTFHEIPAKNQWSHPADALGYLLAGGGESDTVMNRTRRDRSDRRPRIAADVDYDIFGSNSDSGGIHRGSHSGRHDPDYYRRPPSCR